MCLILYFIFTISFFWTSFVKFDPNEPGWYLRNNFYQISLRLLYALIVPGYAFGKIWSDMFMITHPSLFNDNTGGVFGGEQLTSSVYLNSDFTKLFTAEITNPLEAYPSVLSDLGISFVFMLVYLFMSWQLNYAVPYDGFALPYNFFLQIDYLGKIRSLQGILSPQNSNQEVEPGDQRVVFDNVTKKYYGNVRGNRQISTVMEPGNVYGVLGENGSGKSKTNVKENQP
jgi:hypothetical protein